MTDPILEIKNLSKYNKKTKIIDDINLTINENEIIGIIGQNGAEKTTLVKMILGLIKPKDGYIKINGYDIKKQFEKAMIYIGGVTQSQALYGYMSAIDNLKLQAKIRNVNYKKVYDLLDLFGLQKSMNQKINKYSLGMKKKAEIAMALLHSPKLLIIDELDKGLESDVIKELISILKQVADNQNISILVTSQNLNEIESLCDKVAIMNNGKIIEIINLKENEQENKKLLHNLYFEIIKEGQKNA